MSKKKSGRFSKDKGARAERELATKLSKDLNREVKRKLGASREGGSDIELEGYSYFDSESIMRTHPGWSIEIKHHKKLNVDSWWTQTLAQADREGRRPLLCYKKDRVGWYCLYYFEGDPVITDYETWVELFKSNTI